MTKYLVTITTTSGMLGSAPADPEIYKSSIASKKLKDDKAKATPEKQQDLEKEVYSQSIDANRLAAQEQAAAAIFKKAPALVQ